MSENINTENFLEDLLARKKKILCDIVPTGDIATDKLLIPKIIAQTLGQHEANRALYERDEQYYYNVTNVLNKQKTQQQRTFDN